MTTYKSEFLGLVSAVSLLGFLAFTPSAHAEKGPRAGFGGPGAPSIEARVERMAKHLELDEIQRQQISNILEAARPEFDALRERVEGEINAVLTEEQLAKLENMKNRKRERRGDRQ